MSLSEDHAYVHNVSNQWWNNIIKDHAQGEHLSHHTPYSLEQIETCSICEVQVKQNILQKLTSFSCSKVFLHGCYMSILISVYNGGGFRKTQICSSSSHMLLWRLSESGMLQGLLQANTTDLETLLGDNQIVLKWKAQIMVSGVSVTIICGYVAINTNLETNLC